MPGRLIYFIVMALMLALFVGFNLNNVCDVSVVFYTFKNVPIFLSTLFAFIFGMLFTIPFIIFRKRRKNVEVKDGIPGVETVELKKEKRSWFSKKEK